MNTLQLILRSRKVWVALGGLVISILATLGMDNWEPVVIAAVALAGMVIGGIAYEDGQQKGRDVIVHATDEIAESN